MGDVYHSLWRISVDDVVSKFGLFYEQTAGGTGFASARDAAVSIQNNCLAPLQAMLDAEARFESVYVRKITGASAPAWRGNLNAANGSLATGAISAQNCLLINLRNTAGLLKRSGRIFISGTTKDMWLDGVFDVAGFGPIVTTFLNSIATIPPGGGSPWGGFLIVWKKISNGVPNTPPLQIPVDALDWTDVLGTQHVRRGELTGFRA